MWCAIWTARGSRWQASSEATASVQTNVNKKQLLTVVTYLFFGKQAKSSFCLFLLSLRLSLRFGSLRCLFSLLFVALLSTLLVLLWMTPSLSPSVNLAFYSLPFTLQSLRLCFPRRMQILQRCWNTGFRCIAPDTQEKARHCLSLKVHTAFRQKGTFSSIWSGAPWRTS